MVTTIEQWLSRNYNPMGSLEYQRCPKMADERDDLRELAWDLLRRCGVLDGDFIKPRSSGSLHKGCEYFTEIGWLEKIDDRTYRDIKNKTVTEPKGENGDGI